MSRLAELHRERARLAEELARVDRAIADEFDAMDHRPASGAGDVASDAHAGRGTGTSPPQESPISPAPKSARRRTASPRKPTKITKATVEKMMREKGFRLRAP